MVPRVEALRVSYYQGMASSLAQQALLGVERVWWLGEHKDHWCILLTVRPKHVVEVDSRALTAATSLGKGKSQGEKPEGKNGIGEDDEGRADLATYSVPTHA